jgi:hypothetical protein
MSVVWASQTEAPQHRDQRGRLMPNWSMRRLLMALLIVACLLTLASAGATAGHVWRETGAVAVSTLAAAPAPPHGQYSNLQLAVASGMADRWIATATAAAA